MSNSPLVNYTKISPNRNSPRNHAIDTITIHMVVGQCTAEGLGDWFSNPRCGGSSNYGVDKDGRIGMYVEEKDRSWCSSSASNDNRAITIEVASEKEPPYAVNAKAYEALINLCVDICKRNNIKQLLWEGDKKLVGKIDRQNMTVHKWFANTSCPGDYLYSHHSDIAKQVNARLKQTTKEEEKDKVMYRVQIGAYSVKANAEKQLAKAKAAGFKDAFIATTKVETPTESKTPAEPETPKVTLKSVDEIAREVIQGKWGNGLARKQKLTEAGYNYAVIQKRVDEMCK